MRLYNNSRFYISDYYIINIQYIMECLLIAKYVQWIQLYTHYNNQGFVVSSGFEMNENDRIKPMN